MVAIIIVKLASVLSSLIPSNNSLNHHTHHLHTAMANPTTTPLPKRRKLFLAQMTHARNGGGVQSFLAVDAAPWAGADEGSDTEEEDNSEMEQFFLKRMASDTDEKKETVFGEGVTVWKSIGGTVYTDVEEEVKKKLQAEKIWGVKRTADDMEGGDKNKKRKKTDDGAVKYPDIPPVPLVPISAYPILPPPPALLPPPAAYRARTPNDTVFNRGSAGIDPLGAYNRPIKPLPTCRHDTEVLQAPPIRIVSGSFGSFEGQPSRFDERAYRLLPGSGATEKGGNEEQREGKGKLAKKLDPFKGKPWLRR